MAVEKLRPERCLQRPKNSTVQVRNSTPYSTLTPTHVRHRRKERNPLTEMTMSVMRGDRRNNITATTVGTTYWATEFERIYLMTAARICREAESRRADVIRPLSVRGR